MRFGLYDILKREHSRRTDGSQPSAAATASFGMLANPNPNTLTLSLTLSRTRSRTLALALHLHAQSEGALDIRLREVEERLG